jgi:hypothetical protein
MIERERKRREGSKVGNEETVKIYVHCQVTAVAREQLWGQVFTYKQRIR